MTPIKSLFFLLFLTATGISSANTDSLSTSQQASIDALFDRWNQDNSPGLALGIIKNGEMVYSKGYGLANLEHGIANTTNTAFNLASISKQFTAACVLQLAADNKLQLDQTLDQFFPEFPDHAKGINIGHLLHHTSGLRDFTQISYLAGLRPDDYYDNTDIMAWVSQQKALNFEPGEQHMYSNSNYWLLGRIVEKASGMTLATYAEQTIFAPLGMNNTQFIDNNTTIIKNRASGYSPVRSGGHRLIRNLLERTGAAGVFSTIEDLKRWDDAFYSKTTFNTDFWQQMTTAGKLNNGESINYAKGLEIGEQQGHQTISHAGRWPGFQSQMVRFPEQKLTVILLANSADFNAPRMANQVADVFLPTKKVEAAVDSKVPATETINLAEQQLQAFASRYWSTSHGFSREVAVVDGQLTYQRGRGRGNALLALSANSFTMAGTPPGMTVEVRFDVDEKNKGKYQMVFIENDTEVDWFKAVESPSRNEAQLNALTGDYFAEEINTLYSLKPLEDGQLELFINHRPTVILRPEFDQVFSSPLGLIVFELNTKGEPIALTVSTPRVKKLKFVKQ